MLGVVGERSVRGEVVAKAAVEVRAPWIFSELFSPSSTLASLLYFSVPYARGNQRPGQTL